MAEIARIDQEIDAIHKALRKLERIDQYSAASWQRAWDLHPELRAAETELFRQRGIAQQERYAKAAKAVVHQPRYRRPKKCPTCGCHTLAAA